MRPRYEARHVSVWDLEPRPWCVVEHTTHGSRVAVYCDSIEDANSHAVRLNATADGLRRIGVAVAVWAGMAAVQQRAVSVVASEPEYPDAESYSSNARADLIAAGFEHPDEVFVMLVQIARGAVSDTKRCILDRLPIAGPRGVLP